MSLIIECNNKRYSATEWVEALMTGEVMNHDKYVIGEINNDEN